MEGQYPVATDGPADETQAAVPQAAERRRSRLITGVKELIQLVLIVVLLRVTMDIFLPRYMVDGASMEPNFHTHQRVIVDRLTMVLSGPARGDVVVLDSPANSDELLIKRVVGLPGEQIAIRGGRVYVNGEALNEPYVAEFCTYRSCEGVWELGPDEYYVLGDNRMHSLDSHSFGPVNVDSIQGIARIRYWPLTEADILKAPEY